MKILLEACVDNIESAVAAQEAGADRIELCSALLEGGLTPSYGLISLAKRQLDIPIHVLIRPRRGDFLYSPKELEVMHADIEFCQDLGVAAVVFGVLNPDASINTAANRSLIETSANLKTTFHRAFDMTANPEKALKSLIDLGFDKLLTSGRAKSADAAIEALSTIKKQAKSKIDIIAAAGVSHNNVSEIVTKTDIREIHASARAKTKSLMRYKSPQISLSAAYNPAENEHYMLEPEELRLIKTAINKL